MLCITRYREEAREEARTEALGPEEKKEEGDMKKEDAEALDSPRARALWPRRPGPSLAQLPAGPGCPASHGPATAQATPGCPALRPRVPGPLPLVLLPPARVPGPSPPGARPNGPGCPAPPAPATSASRVPGLWTPGCPASTAQAPASTLGAQA
nr:basic proline-rich protein-like [Aegilops tauschii subsp. strangulata]